MKLMKEFFSSGAKAECTIVNRTLVDVAPLQKEQQSFWTEIDGEDDTESDIDSDDIDIEDIESDDEDVD